MSSTFSIPRRIGNSIILESDVWGDFRANPVVCSYALLSIESFGDRVAEYATYGEGTKGWQAQADRIRAMAYDDWLRDKVAYGMPEAVTDRLGQLREGLGLDQIMFEVNYGNQIPQERQLNSLRLFMDQVIPHFK